MLIKKDVWDLIEMGLQLCQSNNSRLWDHKEKEDQILVKTADQIIRKRISDNIFHNIIDINNFQDI